MLKTEVEVIKSEGFIPLSEACKEYNVTRSSLIGIYNMTKNIPEVWRIIKGRYFINEDKVLNIVRCARNLYFQNE